MSGKVSVTKGITILVRTNQNLSPRTKYNYKRNLEILSENLLCHFDYLNDIKACDIEDLKAKMIEKKYGNESINLCLRVLRRLLSVNDLNLKILHGRMMNRHPRERYLNEDEIKRLLRYCYHPSLKLAILISLYTGLRIRNIATLKWNQVDLERDLITTTVKCVGGGKPLKVPIAKILHDQFIDYREQHGRIVELRTRGNVKGKVFGSMTRLQHHLRQLCDSLGFYDVSFHTFRHSFISRLVLQGIDMKTVMELAGHSDIKSTMVYTHIPEDHKRKAVNGIWG